VHIQANDSLKFKQVTLCPFYLILHHSFFVLELVVFNSIFTPIPQGLLAYPPFAYFRCLSILSERAVTWGDMFNAGDPFGEALGILALEGAIMFALAFYFDNVLPKEYGVRRHPFFFVFDLLKLFGIGGEESTTVNLDKLPEGEDDDPNEDEDVKEERNNMIQGLHRESAIQLYGLRKVYHGQGKTKVAVHNLHLHMEKGECFGMLGPNGAGKTTVISVLTGLFASSAGQGLVDGYDINTEMQSVYSVMGLCPQFDVVWPTLTVLEHLLFYVRLKGVAKEDEVENARVAAAAVGLTDAIDRRSSRLSGGMRRRLSLAMSLVGNPNVVVSD
jgi:ABC-type lipoprotein export system ATPase subunit